MSKFVREKSSFLLLLILFSTRVSQPIFASPAAQTEPDANVRIVTDVETGLYTFIGINSAAASAALPGAIALQNGTPTAQTALADLSIYAKEFGLTNPGQELQFMKASEAQGSGRSFRYQQVYQGVPVIAGELIANYNGRGMLAALVGETSAKLSLSTTPRVTVDRATNQALAYVAKAEGVTVTDLTAASPVLSIYDPHLFTPYNDDPTLVWRFEVKAVSLKPIRYFVLVDAAFGGVPLAFNQIDTAWHGSTSVPAQAANPVVANLLMSNVAAPQFAPNFPTPPMRTYDLQGTFQLQNPARLICNTAPTALSGPGSCGNFVGNTDAGAAHYFAYNTFNYFDLFHKRNSINRAGLPLISNVNYCEVACPGGFDNAFWDGVQMVYGDAGFWTADDVIGHELSHGVTEHDSALFYFYESGAINESMSDIFGEFVDQWNVIDSFGVPDNVGLNWELGEDLGIGTIRSMSNPPAFDQPDRTQSAIYYTIQDYPEFNDNGGVHINSGVGNKAAYLMAQGGSFNGFTITAIGNAKTSAIFYEVNRSLLTSGSDYGILAAAIAQACNNVLTGLNTVAMTAADCIEVREATLATEMQLDPVAAVNFRPQAEVCPQGSQIGVSLLNKNLESGLGGFTSGVLMGGGSMPASRAWVDTNLAFGAPYATSGTHSVFGANAPQGYGYPSTGQPYQSYFQMSAGVALPAGSTFYLHFNHSFAFEYDPVDDYDGSVLEYALDGSANWLDAASLYEAGQNYNGLINNNFGNPLGGRQGFVQQSHGYVSSRYNLTTLAGHSVRFRWVIGADFSGYLYGWFLDDIQIYDCGILRNYTTNSTPTLTWKGTTWATSYDIQIADNSTFTNPSVNQYAINPPVVTFTPPVPLLPGTYYWRVRANNGAAIGAWGLADSFTIGS